MAHLPNVGLSEKPRIRLISNSYRNIPKEEARCYVMLRYHDREKEIRKDETEKMLIEEITRARLLLRGI